VRNKEPAGLNQETSPLLGAGQAMGQEKTGRGEEGGQEEGGDRRAFASSKGGKCERKACIEEDERTHRNERKKVSSRPLPA